MSTVPADTAEYTSDDYSGAYSATFVFARNLIAACPTFREEIVKVGSDAEAKLKIYKQETLAEEDPDEEPEREGDPPPEMEPRPYCVLLDEKRTMRVAGTATWVAEGSVIAVFEVPVPAEFLPDHDQDDAAIKRDKFRRFLDWRITLASNLEKEITELSGGSDAAGNPFLNVVSFDLIVPPSDPAEDLADAPFIAFAYSLNWK